MTAHVFRLGHLFRAATGICILGVVAIHSASVEHADAAVCLYDAATCSAQSCYTPSDGIGFLVPTCDAGFRNVWRLSVQPMLPAYGAYNPSGTRREFGDWAWCVPDDLDPQLTNLCSVE